MMFSIVTPSYRQPEWLQLCLASVADQSSPELANAQRLTVEHIVQDACSGERVRAVCECYSGVHLVQEEDEGMYDAVNRGLRRGSGEICAYLNCDEQYLPGTLAAVREYFLTNPQTDVLFGDVVVVDSQGEYRCSRRVLIPHRNHTQVCQLNTFTAATFFRRRILDDAGLYFDPNWKNCGDAAWMLKLLESGVRMGVLRRYLAIFTDTGHNMNLNAEGIRESANLRGSAKWLVRMSAPGWAMMHRLRRLAAGLYESGRLDYEIYTTAAPEVRTHFQVPRSSPIWSERLRWNR